MRAWTRRTRKSKRARTNRYFSKSLKNKNILDKIIEVRAWTKRTMRSKRAWTNRYFSKSLKNKNISGEINRSGVMLEGVDEEGECRRRAWTGRWVSFQRSLNPATSSQTLLDISLNIFFY